MQGEYQKPLPQPTPFDEPYWNYLKAHELRLPGCRSCGHIFFPPQPCCPRCLSDRLDWIPASGRGRVWSWVVFHHVYFRSFAEDIPYVVALVELEEGPRMVSTVVDCSPEDLRCDMPVEVVFDDVTPEFTIPKFRPVKGEAG